MSFATPDLFGRITAVENDHAALLDTLARLRNLEMALSEQAGRTIRGPIALIDEFARHLREHFAAEEADGYFGALIADRPSLRSRIEGLRADHESIVQAVSEITHAATRGIAAHDLANRLGELLDSLQGHERRESVLIQDYLLKDDGVPGD